MLQIKVFQNRQSEFLLLLLLINFLSLFVCLFVFCQVRAVDPDSGKFGAITYDLGSSNVPFSIDSATGVLQTTKEIRYSIFIRDLKQTRTATPTSGDDTNISS